MKSRTTLVLVAFVVVIGLIVIWDHYKGASTEEAAEKGRHILSFKSDDVTRLELAHTNQTIVLEKSGDRWDIKQPLSVPADGGAVNSVLSDLEFAERDRTLSEKELRDVNLADFGLDRPRIRVTLQGKKGPMTLLVGRETPTRDAIYVQLQGRMRIYVTPRSLLERLNASVDSLRSRVAVEFTPSAATRLELKNDNRVIELARTAANTNAAPRWTVVRPLAVRADQSKVSGLLTDLGELRIHDFVSEDPKDAHTYQLEDPQHEVTVWTGDVGKTLLLGRALTNDPTKVYAKLKSADSIFTVSTEQAKRFAIQINDLRDPHVVVFSQPDVFGIDTLQGTNRVTIERGDKGWKVTGPTPVFAEESIVERVLKGLSDLTVKRFAADVAIDLDKFGLAAPTAAVTLRGEGTNAIAQLLIGGLDDSHTLRYVKRADEPFIYGVESNALEWLPANALAVRARRLAEVQPEQIRKLTIQKGSSRTILECDVQNKWRLVEPAQGVLDNDSLQRLLGTVAQLRAGEFLREGRDNLAEYGLDAPEFTLAAQTGDKTYTLALGKPAEGGLRYALWNDPTLVFTVGTAELEPITKPIVTTPPAAGTAMLTNAVPSVEAAKPAATPSSTNVVPASSDSAAVPSPSR